MRDGRSVVKIKTNLTLTTGETLIMKKMTIWGVGPKIMFPSYCVLAILFLMPIQLNISEILNIPKLYIRVASLVFISAGIIFLLITDAEINKAFRTNRLITTGLFSLVRNPMYAAHMFFLMPGICLLTNNATTTLAIVVAVIIFNGLIPKEEIALEENFGIEYVDYKKRVNRLMPKIDV